MEPGTSSASRLATLDGLRGWAALSVVVYHATWETFGIVFPAFRSPAASLLGNGSLAVAIFFTLSGYVLTLRRWHRTDNPNLLLVLVRRYFRLGIPIMAAVLVAWAIMSLGLAPNREAAKVVLRGDWLGTFANFPPNLFDAVWYGLVRVYWIAKDHVYGPFLWTMAIELWGSVFVLSLSHSPKLFREAYTPLLLFLVLLLRFFPLAACFPAGAIIALLQRDGHIWRTEPGPLESFVSSSLLVAALLAAASFQIVFPSLMPAAFAGTLVFIGAARSKPAHAVLSMPLSGWLGRISFPLYLIQYAVLITVTSWSIIQLDAAGLLTPWTALGVAVVSTAAALLAATAFLPVEVFTLGFVRRLGWPRARSAVAKA
ncbi:MAG: acyltransferase [Devosia nanyangense]|uniref:Acyltransferase n=1 Tax=Devosia nanyangense TaxID=1228055 RepID=A0A933L1H3_9HYPH|nr:acyltransferase [Devosia nanyangense]